MPRVIYLVRNCSPLSVAQPLSAFSVACIHTSQGAMKDELNTWTHMNAPTPFSPLPHSRLPFHIPINTHTHRQHRHTHTRPPPSTQPPLVKHVASFHTQMSQTSTRFGSNIIQNFATANTRRAKNDSHMGEHVTTKRRPHKHEGSTKATT